MNNVRVICSAWLEDIRHPETSRDQTRPRVMQRPCRVQDEHVGPAENPGESDRDGAPAPAYVLHRNPANLALRLSRRSSLSATIDHTHVCTGRGGSLTPTPHGIGHA